MIYKPKILNVLSQRPEILFEAILGI